MKRVIEELDQIIDTVVPVRKRPAVNKNAPIIFNIISTLSILPKGGNFRLPLEAIAARLGPAAQFCPFSFAAVISKFEKSTSNSTSLIFGSGNIVNICTLTEWDSISFGHLIRCFVENIEGVFCDPETKQVVIGTLAQRTVFENNTIQNIVGNGNLGVKLDLSALREANPECVYIPDGFKAAKYVAWLTEDCLCHCKKSTENEELNLVLKKKKCSCTIKCLLFETGEIVLAGGHAVKDITSVFYRIKKCVGNIQKVDAYKSLGQIMAPHKHGQKIRKPGEVGTFLAVAKVLTQKQQQQPPGYQKKRGRPCKKKKEESSETALMKLCDSGRLSEVKKTLEFDPGQLNLTDSAGRTALQRLLMHDRTAAQDEIVEYLLSINPK